MLSTSDNVDVKREDIQCLIEGLIETVRACDSWENWNLCDHREWTDGYVSACLKALRIPAQNLPECDICERVLPSEDDLEKCDCGREVCEKCSSHDREWDTGAEIFKRCLTCEEDLGKAERLEAWAREREPDAPSYDCN